MSLLLIQEPPGALVALWIKYRPVILHLMLTCHDKPAQYRLYSHEFRALAKSNTFAFVLQAHRGRAINDIRKSQVAKDLMSMLKTSRKASERLENHAFEFRLDTQFMLIVSKISVR